MVQQTQSDINQLQEPVVPAQQPVRQPVVAQVVAQPVVQPTTQPVVQPVTQIRSGEESSIWGKWWFWVIIAAVIIISIGTYFLFRG